MKFELNGHIRSHNDILCLKIPFSLINFNLMKTIYEECIMNTQIFHKIKYDLKDHGKSQEDFLAKFCLAHTFINKF